jgi:hypothetical protein
MSKVKISGNASGTGTFTIAAPNSNTDRTLTLPDEAGTLITSAISSFSTGSGTANSIASNTYTNIVSSLSLPNNSMIIAYFKAETSNSNTPSNATYGMAISTASNSASIVAYQNGVGVYPKSGIAPLAGTLMYFNGTGSTQSIWLAGYPYASSNYNTPNYTVTYYIVSFS